MSGVFLSYKKVDDATRASVVRTRLEALGLQIFQDVDMSAGAVFHDILNDQIKAATVVLVLWTKTSIHSHWVASEAQKGFDLVKLVGVTFDRIIPRDMPMPFNGIQTPDLSDWIETGSKANHPGWRSVLKALGVLFERPFSEIADILEAGTLESKADFVRRYPNDPITTGLAQDLKASKLSDFEQQAKQRGEKQLADEIRRLNQLRGRFVSLVDAALSSGAYEQLDAQQEIQKVLNPHETDLDDGRSLKRTRKDLLQDIARLRSEITALTNSAAASEGAKAEIAGTAEQLRSQLEAAKSRLRDFENQSEWTKSEIDGQQLKIADLERRARRTGRPPAWVLATVAIFGIGVVWLASGTSSQRSDLISVDVANAERQKVQDRLDSATKQLDTADVENRRLADDAARKLDTVNKAVTSLSKEKDNLSSRLADVTANLGNANDASGSLTKKLDAANKTVTSLSKEKDDLSSRLTDATANLSYANDAYGSITKKLDAANKAVTSLSKEKDDLSSRLTDATANLGNANGALGSVTKKFDAANGAVDVLTREKKQLSDQLGDANSRLGTATAKITSLSQELAATTSIQATEAARATSEGRCNEMTAYDTDADLPADAKRPADQAKLTPNWQEAIDNCLLALSTLPKQASRRIVLQLARSYILQRHGARQSNQAVATDSYTTAVVLANLASRLGSTQAEMILGYIYGGNFNVPRFNYVLPNTPDYPYALEKFEISAGAKNPFGLLYAGSYLLWPGCSQNAILPAPDKGLQYIRQAQEKKIAAAYYAEGYYWYFGAPGVKSDQERGLELFDRARKMKFTQAEAFLGKTPPKPDTCPKVIF
jgi:predicted  nucleic acid-binding Zn-ribbon protein